MTQEKIDFLFQRLPDDIKSDISIHLYKVLQSKSPSTPHPHETIFSALRYTPTEFTNYNSGGKKTTQEFQQYVAAHGFKMGETAKFFEIYKDALTYTETVTGRTTFDKIIEKRISDIPTDDPHLIFIDDYRAHVAVFVELKIHRESQIGLISSIEMAARSSSLPEEMRTADPSALFNELVKNPELMADLDHIRTLEQEWLLRARLKFGIRAPNPL